MKKILIISCTSFTAVMLLFALFSMFEMAPEISKTITVQVFVITVSIAILMTLAEKIEDRFEVFSILADALMRILLCYFVIFIEGYLFGWFEFSFKALIYITPILIPAFLITYLVSYLTCVEYAEAINRSIKRKK